MRILARDQDSWRALDGFLRDLRFAVRSLRRTPVFALTAALVLGLGIGANATVFTIVNTLLLRPLPFERADDIVQVQAPDAIWQQRQLSDARLPRAHHASEAPSRRWRFSTSSVRVATP